MQRVEFQGNGDPAKNISTAKYSLCGEEINKFDRIKVKKKIALDLWILKTFRQDIGLPPLSLFDKERSLDKS